VDKVAPLLEQILKADDDETVRLSDLTQVARAVPSDETAELFRARGTIQRKDNG